MTTGSDNMEHRYTDWKKNQNDHDRKGQKKDSFKRNHDNANQNNHTRIIEVNIDMDSKKKHHKIKIHEE